MTEDYIHTLTCFPPPLLGWMLEMMEGPAGPPLLLLPVQLLQRISPWFPFFHMDEEFVLHTAQHGFNPSGIVGGSVKSWTMKRWPLAKGSLCEPRINPMRTNECDTYVSGECWRHWETISGNTSAPSDPDRIASCVIYCDRDSAAIADTRVSFSTLLLSAKYEKGAAIGQDELLTWHFRKFLSLLR